MIGLGSNRLSVCRRGGMSVTQAGRGGMEWLTGGRWPSWASPYSAAATAALKAAFTAAQWQTIKAYGFAHPEIVGYMNAYAPEDAKIAYSLVEGIGTRWITATGTQYIDTGILNNSEISVDVYAQYTTTSQTSFAALCGAADTASGANRFSIRQISNLFRCAFGSNGVSYGDKRFDLLEHRFTLSKVKFTLDESTWNINDNTPYTGSTNIYIFTEDIIGSMTDRMAKANIKYFKMSNSGTKVREMYPFIRKINGVDTCGMIDVLSGTFYQNAGSGSFTISETPAS